MTSRIASTPETSGDPGRLADPARALWMRRSVAFAVAIPDRLLIISMCAMLAAAITVQLSIFHPYTFFPLFLLLVAVSWKLSPAPLVVGSRRLRISGDDPDGAGARTVPRSLAGWLSWPRWQWIGPLVAVVVCLVWFLLQRNYYSELLSVRRDPSIYTLRGFWLMNHSSPDVYLNQQLLDIRKAVPKAGLDFGGETGRLIRYFQSTTVVPGLIAVAGWIGGPSLLLQGNLIIGTASLMCTYAVGRRMAGPVFGMVPMVALAAGMPLASFSRVAYTEPLSMIAFLACVLGLWEGARTGRAAMWLLAGFGAGGVVVARVDGWLVVIGGLVAIALWGAATSSRESRRKSIAALLLFSVSAFPMAVLGYIDLKFHSPDYLVAVRSSVDLLLKGVVVAAVLAFAVVLVPGGRWVAGRMRAWDRGLTRWSIILVVLLMLAMIARPLYYHAHLITAGAQQIGIKGRQVAEGQPVDPSRSYDEQSLDWIGWYQGWPTVILACLVGLYAIRASIRERFAPILLVVAVVAVNAGLYLNIVSITPDQIWAMRRFLPVILPGGLLIAAWGLNQMFERREAVAALLARWLPRQPAVANARVPAAVAMVAGLFVGIYPVATWGPMFPVREGDGQYDFVQNICTYVHDQKVILLGPYPAMGFYQPTFRNLCNSTVVTLPSSDVKTLGVARAKADEKAKLAKIMAVWGVDTVKVVTFNPADPMPWTTKPGPPEVTDTYRMWESVLSHRPRTARTETTSIWFGMAKSDGSIEPQ